jgi:hypothetical protein
LRRVNRNSPIVLFAAFLLWHVGASASNSITTCAIRWDAWYTNGPTDPGGYAAAALSPQQFHDLAPLHAKFDPSGHIKWAPSQATFDAEIRAAHGAGLCWAYLMYGKNGVIDLSDPLMKGLVFHRASSIKSQVDYALMTTTGLIGKPGQYDDSTKAIVDLMADSNYQHVSDRGQNRPLLFVYYQAADVAKIFAGSLAAVKQSMDAIRKSSANRGLGNPYIVVLLGPAKAAEDFRIAVGADAISEYISGNRKKGVEPWGNFETTIEADWNAYAAATSAAIVPNLRSGADIRARCQTPPPYDHRFQPGFDCGKFYIINPTLAELKTEFQDATSWVRSHPQRDPTGLLLVYSWSECDESGNCLMPTYGDPDGRKLKAISAALH